MKYTTRNAHEVVSVMAFETNGGDVYDCEIVNVETGEVVEYLPEMSPALFALTVKERDWRPKVPQ